MFEVGETVECVDDTNDREISHISEGVKYKIIRTDGHYVEIKCDNGEARRYASNRFVRDTVKPLHQGEQIIEQYDLDSHYNFTYKLTPEDISVGSIKLDPYFVSSQWKLGSKDESGALWHVFKTIARFGEKNDKEREVRAMFASLKRLAQILNITLEK